MPVDVVTDTMSRARDDLLHRRGARRRLGSAPRALGLPEDRRKLHREGWPP
jgi:hypothetical protein